MKKIYLILVYILIVSGKLTAQTHYMVYVTAELSSSRASGFICNDRSIHYITVWDETNQIWLDAIANYEYVSDGIHGAWVFPPISSKALSVRYTDLKGNDQKIIFPLYAGQCCVNEQRKSQEGTICWHTSWITVNATAYYPPPPSNPNIDPSVCINVYSDKYNINYENSIVKGIKGMKKPALESSINNFSSINTDSLNLSLSSYDFTYNALTHDNPDAYLGQDIYFRIKYEYNPYGMPTYFYSDVFGPRKFNKKIPDPVINSFVKSKCGKPDTIRCTVDATVSTALNKYKFRLANGNENTSGTFILAIDPNKSSGQNLTFIAPPGSIPQTSTTIYLQIFNAFQGDDTKRTDLLCPGIGKKNILQSTDSLILNSYILKGYSFNGEEYNLTYNGAHDGQATISVNKGSLVAKWQYSSEGGKNWQDLQANRFTQINPNTIRVDSLYRNTKYCFRAVDNVNCPTSSGCFGLLNEPDPLQPKAIALPVSCHPSNGITKSSQRTDGQLQINWTGGIGPYDITITDSSSITTINHTSGINDFSFILPNQKPGLYNILLRGYSPFEQRKTSVRVETNLKLTLSALPTDLACYNDNSGSLYLSCNKVGTNFRFFYGTMASDSTSATDVLFENMKADKKLAKVINNLGCYDSIPNVTIKQPVAISMNYTVNKIARYNDVTGKIITSASGGTQPYQLTLKNVSGNIISDQQVDASITYGSLKAGIYNIYLKDSHQCSDSIKNILIQQPSAPLKLVITSTKDAKCNGTATGEVRVKAAGGWGYYQYGIFGKIVGADTIFQNIKAKIYPDTIFVIDSMNVKEFVTFMIGEPSALSTSIAKINNLMCYGDKSGSVRINVSGGTSPYMLSKDSISWDSGSTFSQLNAGNYKFWIRDYNKCFITTNALVTQPSKVSITDFVTKKSTCNRNDGHVLATVTGGTVWGDYTYKWLYLDSSLIMNSTTNNLYNIYSGLYKLTVFDKNYCKTSDSVFVSDTNGPVIKLFSVDSVTCYGYKNGKIHITKVEEGQAPYSYFLDNKRFNIDTGGLAPGRYLVKVEDMQHCKVGLDTNIWQPSGISIHSVMQNPTCYGFSNGAIAVYPSGGNGGYKYRWNTNDTVYKIQNLSANLYDATVTDRKNCFAKKKLQLLNPEKIAIQWDRHETIICTGNKITLYGGSFSTYCWTKGNDTLSRNHNYITKDSGIYVLKVTDNNGCIGLDSFRVKVSDHPLDAIFLLQSTASLNEEINAIDVTWPVPDSIEWLFDKDVMASKANSWSKSFTPKDTGKINVTLRAWYGGCYSDSTKDVYVMGITDTTLKSSKVNDPLILNFVIYPNPNTGRFTAEVDLSRNADISLSIFASGKSLLLDNRFRKDVYNHKEDYDISNYVSGIYLLVVRAENEQKILKLIIE